jgi:hypothetical protein
MPAVCTKGDFMKNAFLLFALLFVFSESFALAVVFTGAMDNRTGFAYIPGFTAQSRAWVNGGDEGGGLRLEWQAENETQAPLWTYTYRLLRNSAKNKGFAFFDIETADDFEAETIADNGKQVVAVTDRNGATIPSGLASVTISNPLNFVVEHDFSNSAVTEANPLTVLSKTDLSHYSGDPGRVPPGVAGGLFSATPSVGPVFQPFYGIRVTFPGDFASLINLGYEASEWEFRIVTSRVPMWGDVFGWGDQTILSPFWYSNFYNNRIDDTDRLALAPVDSLTGAGPYQGWVLVPGPLPSVNLINPAVVATDIPVTEPVTAVFSGLMDPATITGESFTLTDPGSNLIDGTVNYDQPSKTATFTPNAPLLPNVTYTATITTSATDLAGNSIAAPISWNFTTTAVDNVPPTVTAKVPDNGATFLGITTPITATFSERMNPSTINQDTFTVSSVAGQVDGTVAFDPAIRTATFTPDVDNPLANNTVYTATITTGATDLVNNAMATPEQWSFTTIPRETILPFIPATVPAVRAGNVPINTPITATFTESMDPATINETTFTVDGLTGTVSYDDPTRTATFTPATLPLGFRTTYRATISTGVRDLAGNPLPLTKQWSFTTAAPDSVPPLVTGTTPFDNARNVPVTSSISATFSERIIPSTISPASFTVTGRAYSTDVPTIVTGTVIYTDFTTNAQFLPTTPLTFGTVYSAVISTDIQDLAGNPMTAAKSWSFTTIPDGIMIPGESSASIADALKALRIAVKLIQPVQDDLNHGDVAPLDATGKPNPDGEIDIRDALVILRKVVGLISW